MVLLFPRAFSRWIALLTTTASFAISLATFFCHDLDLAHFTTIVRVPWVPALGMNYHLAVDGISLTLVLVTSITAISSVLFSWDVANPASGGQLLPSDKTQPDQIATRSSWATQPVEPTGCPPGAKQVDQRPNEIFFWLLLVVGGSFGVFLGADLLLLLAFF